MQPRHGTGVASAMVHILDDSSQVSQEKRANFRGGLLVERSGVLFFSATGAGPMAFVQRSERASRSRSIGLGRIAVITQRTIGEVRRFFAPLLAGAPELSSTGHALRVLSGELHWHASSRLRAHPAPPFMRWALVPICRHPFRPVRHGRFLTWSAFHGIYDPSPGST
jgi:hypothetical protein